MNGSLFVRRDEVMGLATRRLEGKSQSKRNSGQTSKGIEPSEVKIQICTQIPAMNTQQNIIL